MPALDGWDIERYRACLRMRAQLIRLNPKIRVRFDESDLVQETFIKAADPETPPCLGTSDRERLRWLEEIQTNVSIDLYRKQHAQKRDIKREQEVRQLLDQSTVHWEGNIMADDESPLEQITRKDTILVVAEAIQQLPPDQRDAVLARELLHLDMKQVAEVVGRSEAAAAGLVRRGLKKLKEILRGEEDDA